MAIKNIIFDLGGVLLNLDFNRTILAFEKLGISNVKQYFEPGHSKQLFATLEEGGCSPGEFYEEFRELTGLPLTDETIENAWNAMLLDFRKDSVDYLQSLRGNFRLFLLSNTNQIHLDAIRLIHFRQRGHHGFDEYFEKAWYSHELKIRKPDTACYLEVLKHHGIDGADTLFVDDTLVNIQGAKNAGIQTLHLQQGMVIEQEIPILLQ